MMKEIVIVSGGANGIGYELVGQLIDKGYIVCNIDFDSVKTEQLNQLSNESYVSFIGDVSDESFVQSAIHQISGMGAIKALINCAGEPSFKLPTEYNKMDIDKCFKGLYGMIMLTTEVLKSTNETDVKIINIISSAALRGNKQESVYCATKWGEKGYTESLKVAYKGTTVKVIGVYPGGVNTNFYKDSRDYVSIEKQNTFMPARDLATVIINNAFSELNLNVVDIVIERN